MKAIKLFLKKLIPQPLRQYLRSNRHLLSILSTEYNFRFRRKETKAHLDKIRHMPRGLHIECTNICNAKCVFCAYPQMQRPKQVMPLDEFRKVIDEYIEMGGQHVSLSPLVGDPFVDPHIVDRLDYLYNREEIRGFYFFTNAILMKPEKSRQLLKYASKLGINVSWGGFNRETYKSTMGVDKFDMALENVEAFIEMKRKAPVSEKLRFIIHLRCPPSAKTGEVWDRFQEYQREGLINKIESLGSYDSWAGKIAPDDLREVGLVPRKKPYKRGACELLFTRPIVLVNGKVNACACRDVEAELVVGDLGQSKLSEIWAGEGINSIIDRHERGDFPDVCKRCTFYVSVYDRRRTQIFDPNLNWRED